MRAIAVDDEKMGLSRITRLLNESEYVTYVKGYTHPGEAIENVEADDADIAFLDIEMPDINGLMLAEILMEKSKKIEVIFLTAYDKYALKAFEVNAIGYLLKPVSLDKINEKIEKIFYRKSRISNIKIASKIYIKVFPYFLISTDKDMKNTISFRTEKAKELLGYLISFNGKPISKDKLIYTLWEDMEADKAAKNLHTNFYYLRKNFKEIGIDEIILRKQNGYSINEKYIVSDLNVFFQGIEEMKNKESNIEIVRNAFFIYNGYYFGEEDYLWTLEKQGYYGKYLEDMGIFLAEYYERISEDREVEKVLKHLFEVDSSSEKAYIRLIKLYLKKGDQFSVNKLYKSFKTNFEDDMTEDY